MEGILGHRPAPVKAVLGPPRNRASPLHRGFRSACFERDGKQPPFTRNSIQDTDASVFELDAGPGHSVPDGACDEKLVGVGLCCDPRADMYGNPADLVPGDFAVPRMQSGAEVNARLTQGRHHRACASNRACQAVEGCEKPITRGIDLPSSKACKLPGDQLNILRPRNVLRKISAVFRG